MIVKKLFVLCLSLLLLSAMFSGCGASPSSNNPAAGSGKQQSEENTETTLSNETEDSENMAVLSAQYPQALNDPADMA